MDKEIGGRRCAFASGVGALPCNARSEGPRPIPDWALQSRCPDAAGVRPGGIRSGGFRENPHEPGWAERLGACAGGRRGELLASNSTGGRVAGLGAAGYTGCRWIGCFS